MFHHLSVLFSRDLWHVGADGLGKGLLGLGAHLCLAGSYACCQFVLGQQCLVEVSVAHFES